MNKMVKVAIDLEVSSWSLAEYKTRYPNIFVARRSAAMFWDDVKLVRVRSFGPTSGC